MLRAMARLDAPLLRRCTLFVAIAFLGCAPDGADDDDREILGVQSAALNTPRACRTVDLEFTLKAGNPGAGQRFATVVATNVSGTPCFIHGYGGLALLGAPAEGVPTDLRREPRPAAGTVTLAAGASARSLLHWTVIPAPDEPAVACEPTAPTVVVTPPGETTSAIRRWSFGPVCQHGRIDQNAYVAGGGAF
jgi:hypothetical protein